MRSCYWRHCCGCEYTKAGARRNFPASATRVAKLRELLAGDLAIVPGDGLATELDRAFVALPADDDAVAGLGAGQRGGDGLAAVLNLDEVIAADASGLLGVTADLADDGGGILAARVLVREHGKVGAFRGGATDAEAAAGIALARGAGHDDEVAVGDLAQDGSTLRTESPVWA